MALAGGATPICVVSSPEKADICRRMGAELIIDRSAEGYRFWNDDNTAQNPKEWQRLGKKDSRAHRRPRRRHRLRAPRPRDLRRQRLRHPQGRDDHDLRVDLRLHARVRQPLPVDNLKRIISSHFANYREAWRPTTSTTAASSTRPCPRPTVRRGRSGSPPTCTTTRTRARSASSRWLPGRDWASRPGEAQTFASRTRSTGSPDA